MGSWEFSYFLCLKCYWWLWASFGVVVISFCEFSKCFGSYLLMMFSNLHLQHRFVWRLRISISSFGAFLHHFHMFEKFWASFRIRDSTFQLTEPFLIGGASRFWVQLFKRKTKKFIQNKIFAKVFQSCEDSRALSELSIGFLFVKFTCLIFVHWSCKCESGENKNSRQVFS